MGSTKGDRFKGGAQTRVRHSSPDAGTNECISIDAVSAAQMAHTRYALEYLVQPFIYTLCLGDSECNSPLSNLSDAMWAGSPAKREGWPPTQVKMHPFLAS